jgi:mono/diheme cytochrome c family protein
MNRAGWFLLGAGSLFAIAFGAGAAFVLRSHGFSASEPPSDVERWIARKARSAAIPADDSGRVNPIPNSPDALAESRAHWADHCAVCHANDGSGDTPMGKRTDPPAPDMRLPATQGLTDGELFFIIENGIRLSGMPAWGGGPGHQQDSWKLVHFIRHLPQLTVEEKKEMGKLNPKSPDERKEEEEEERFLKGDDSNANPIEHHHH